jgi:hypothetical protein
VPLVQCSNNNETEAKKKSHHSCLISFIGKLGQQKNYY